MQDVHQALNEVKDLYRQVVGRPAPEIPPASCLSFPPGVDPVNHAIEEVNQLKRLSREIERAPALAAWAPAADTFATTDGFLVRLDLPDVAREDLRVFITGGECIVRGQRKQPLTSPERRPLVIERPWGPFERRFALPAGTNPERVAARYRDGVLELQLAGEGAGIPGEMTVEVA
jgi:HSP20 family protein